MIREQIIIQNKLGLHTRAAARLVDIAKRFGSHIELAFRNRTVDAKSIMGVITLGAQKGNEVELLIEGEDENDALIAIKKIVDDKFGED